MSKFFTYLGTSTFRKNLIAAIVAVVVLLLAVFYGLSMYTRHGEGLPVPKLKGMSVENAIELLESQDLRYQIDSIYQVDKQPGMVVEQDPDPNTNVKVKRTIYLTIITRLAPDVNFPDIEGKTFLEARAILNNYGLKLGDTTYKSDVARDVVLEITFGEQPINVGENLAKGSRIDLVLGDGLGASEVDLPDLTGLTLEEARLSLMGSSLSLGNVGYDGIVLDSTTATIIKQSPALSDSLNKVSIGSRVDVVLSTGN